MTPAQGLREIVRAQGILDGVSGWKGIVSGVRSEANIAAFLDTGGMGGEVKVAIDYPSVQIIVQGGIGESGYLGAYNKSRELYDALQGIETIPALAEWPNLVSCVAVNQPLFLGRDDQGRPQFSLNFRLIVTPENIGNRPY